MYANVSQIEGVGGGGVGSGEWGVVSGERGVGSGEWGAETRGEGELEALAFIVMGWQVFLGPSTQGEDIWMLWRKVIS